MQPREGRLIQLPRLHHPALRQPVDDHLDEAYLLAAVAGLVKELGGGDPVAMISSINIGAHLVDTSPLSTLGALCIACAGDHEDKAVLFRKLLIWGLSMSIVGAVICYIFFGLLGM